MIEPREYLLLARRLAAGSTEAEWRSAISRAYYAVFHLVLRFFEDLGFHVPRADSAHKYLVLRLLNCKDPQTETAGGFLDDLRHERNVSDYDLLRDITQPIAQGRLQVADQIIQSLAAARHEPVRTQITVAMKDYERVILKSVTWQP